MSSAPDLGFVHHFVPAERGGLPTLLLLHGTGGDENDLLALGPLLLPGAALLSPRGKVLEHGAPRFFRRLAEGVFDQEDLGRRAHELAGFVGAAADAYGFDAANVVAVGYSNGANIAAAVLLLRPGTLAGAILFRAMAPLDPDPAPDLTGLPIFVSGGRLDPLIPPEHTERLVALLQRRGADVTTAWQTTGHGLTREDVQAAREWIAARFVTPAGQMGRDTQ
jgi:predicted esterase